MEAATTNFLTSVHPDESIRPGQELPSSSDSDELQSQWYNTATARVADFGRTPFDRIGITSIDPFARYPFILNKPAQQLMHVVHVSNTGPLHPFKVVAFRLIWVEISRIDAAPFHQYIAGAQAYFDFLRNAESSPLIVAHRACALRLTNAQVAKTETASSDGVIASLLLLARYDQMHGDFQKWNMHMRGIKQIIRLRGDVDQIGMNPLLRHMISNLDISGSLVLDTHPYFRIATKPLDPPWPRLPRVNMDSFTGYFIQIWRSHFLEHTRLIDIVCDIYPETQHLLDEISRTKGTIWSDTLYIWHHIHPPLHRLLSIPKRNPICSSSLVAEALRLGSIIYLSTIRYAFGISPFQSGAPALKVKALFDTFEYTDIEQDALNLGWGWIKIWVLGCAVINRPSGPDGNWFVHRLNFELENIGLQGWDDFEKCVGFFLWIPEVHGVLLRRGSVAAALDPPHMTIQS